MRRGSWLAAAVLVFDALGFGVRPAAAADGVVQMQNSAVPGQYAFAPSTQEVTVGDRVTWTNVSSATHTVTSDGTGPLDSGSVSPGDTYSHTFVRAGTFAYHCSIHSYMHGTVVVSEEATTTTFSVPRTTTTRPTTTTRAPTTTSRATTTTSAPFTDETLALDTSTSEVTTTTAGQLAIKTNNGTSNGAAVAILVLAIGAILGGGGFLLYRLRSGRF